MFQFYPSSDDQIQLITSVAQKAGFGGGIVVDYPNSRKAKKVFLCLFVGGGGGQQEMPKGLEVEEEEDGKALFEKRRERERLRTKNGKRKNIKDKDWILKKKEVSPHMAVTGNSHKTCTLALQKEREGRCSPRLQVHGTEAQASFLKSYSYN